MVCYSDNVEDFQEGNICWSWLSLGLCASEMASFSFPANGISVGWLLEACFLLQNPHCRLHVSLIHIHLLLAHKFSLLNINISLRLPASISPLPLDTQLLMYSPLPPDDAWICPQARIETGLCSILWYWQEEGPFALALPVLAAYSDWCTCEGTDEESRWKRRNSLAQTEGFKKW